MKDFAFSDLTTARVALSEIDLNIRMQRIGANMTLYVQEYLAKYIHKLLGSQFRREKSSIADTQIHFTSNIGPFLKSVCF